MDWKNHAAGLAAAVVHPSSHWFAPIAATPRHEFVPRWWENIEGVWTLRDGASDPQRWLKEAYSDRSLVTRVGSLHADHATADDHPTGLPTSSSTPPSLIVTMLHHAVIDNDNDTLCVTGSGYGTALLTQRLADWSVTSMDIDPYLVDAARERLACTGYREQLARSGSDPYMEVGDITGPLPAHYDRIVSTVAVPGIPASWLTALRPGGRLVTNLAGTGMIITADMTPDGGATGQVVQDRAGFMPARSGDDYPPALRDDHACWTEVGKFLFFDTGRYPVIDVESTWELRSTFALAAPGVHHGYREDADGVRTAVMADGDGSWARAVGRYGEQPRVYQAGPQRLWDLLDGIRHDMESGSQCPVYGARVTIDPDGTLHLARGQWTATVPPTPGSETVAATGMSPAGPDRAGTGD